MFADVFTMALVLGTIGTVHEEDGEETYDRKFKVRPAWRGVLRTRLAAILGAIEAARLASRFGW